MKNFKFVNAKSDKCVFLGEGNGFIVYLGLYVDDGMLISKSKIAINDVLIYLKSCFQITVDEAEEFIGLEISRNRENRTIKISQTRYIEKLLCKFNLKDSNSVGIPAEPGLYLNKCKNFDFKTEF